MDYIKFQNILNEGASKLKISLTRQQATSFYKYLNELILWNKKINLISRASAEEIIYKDFFDSLTINKYLDSRIFMADLGSGAGFPGIPVKIIRPEIPITLFEINRKRIYFLKHIIRCLKLEGIEAHWDQGRKSKKTFDVIVSRAFGPLAKFMDEGTPMLNLPGILLAMKGKRGEEELERTKSIMKKMGFTLLFCDHFNLPFLEHERTVIGLRKDSCST